MTVRSTNITTTEHGVAKEARWRANGHRGGVLWLTGLSASGKTTLAFDTGTLSGEESLAVLLEYVDRAFAVPEEAATGSAALGS